MIDFRYHLVSIVAVFLALALGLVLGATALSNATRETLARGTENIAAENRNLREQKQDLEQLSEGNGQFVTALTPQIVNDLLPGERVLLVALPGGNRDVHDQVHGVVAEAGATISGTVTIHGKYLADDQTAVLQELTGEVKPEELRLPQGTSYDQAAAVLASVLVTGQESRAGQEDSAGGQVLEAFKELGFLTTSGKPAARATLAIVIAPSQAIVGNGAEMDNAALLSLADALDRAGRGTVLAGPRTAAQEGGLISVLRGDDVADRVSAVDTADTPAGQVTTVYSLVEQEQGKSGQYGVEAGAKGFLPTPLPSPSG